MAKASVRLKFAHALDIRRNFAAKFALDPIIFFNDFAKAIHFRGQKVFCFFRRINARHLQGFPPSRKTDPEYIRERILDSFFVRDVYAYNTHVEIVISSRLTRDLFDRFGFTETCYIAPSSNARLRLFESLTF